MLKKIVVLLLICIYLFNLAGYRLFFDYFIYRSNEYTVQELDKGNYNESALIEMRVPLNLPYYTSLDEYERYDGEIELNGAHYNFVKRKVFNDTLYLLCLPNAAKTELYKAKNAFAAKEANNAASKKDAEAQEKKDNFEKEYNRQVYLQSPPFVLIISSKKDTDAPPLLTCFIPSPVKPPGAGV